MRTLTKVPMQLTTVRISNKDSQLCLAAAAIEGVSRSEFLRQALRERANRVLYSKKSRAGSTEEMFSV
jgi:uncharacterized protein (DUF1778 family)